MRLNLRGVGRQGHKGEVLPLLWEVGVADRESQHLKAKDFCDSTSTKKNQICAARDKPGTSKQAAPLVRRLDLVVATAACSAKRSKSDCDENSKIAYSAKKHIFKWLALSIIL